MSNSNKSTPIKIKKLNQDDILEILIEHFWNGECKELLNARAIILGSSNKDLRAICLFGDENDTEISGLDLERLDIENEFNGDHSFIEQNPSFNLNK